MANSIENNSNNDDEGKKEKKKSNRIEGGDWSCRQWIQTRELLIMRNDHFGWILDSLLLLHILVSMSRKHYYFITKRNKLLPFSFILTLIQHPNVVSPNPSLAISLHPFFLPLHYISLDFNHSNAIIWTNSHALYLKLIILREFNLFFK